MRWLAFEAAALGFEKDDERCPLRESLIAQPMAGNAARPNFQRPIDKSFHSARWHCGPGVLSKVPRSSRGRNRTYTVKGVGVFL
jgi:hypothetical protein